MSCVKFLSYFPPIFVVILFLWLYLTYLIVFCIFYLEDRTKTCIYLIVINIFAIMFLWSYIRSIFTEHEEVPFKYKVRLEASDNTIKYSEQQIAEILKNAIRERGLQIFTRTEYGKVRYCRFCHQIKPDRTHHCSTCQKCILKMDHHCPWIYNCVGFLNQKQFILMLMYATILCFIFVGTVVEFLGDVFDFQDNEDNNDDNNEDNDDHVSNLTKIFLALGWCGSLLFGSMIGILFFYNLANVFKNATTLETLRETNFVDEGYSFSMGCCDNFSEVFGSNPCLWLIPVQTARGNGHEFPVDFRLE